MEDFKKFFEKDYQGINEFVNKIISAVFGNLFVEATEDILQSNPNYKPAAERANILSIKRFGACDDLDVPLQFFDITLSETIRLAYSRVNIQALVRQLMETYSAALIVFHYPDNKGDWRVSYVSKDSNATDATSAKRYTYLMGENQKCRTAAERFAILANKEKNVANITEAFSVEALTKDFYKELFAWYQWALSDNDGFETTYPNDTSIETDDRKIDEHIIRLITRLMFVWFIKQKKLVPEKIFKTHELQNILKSFDPTSKDSGNYYNAILQNLFFATLNKPINEREFASLGSFQEQREHYGIKTLFRDAKEGTWFNKSKEGIIELFKEVPFLNGGLFECLDKENTDGKFMYYDGFSRKSGRQSRAFLPNCLFFDPERGIIPLLEKYNFTVEENTPSDVEVALDPELLGKVFENLLGAFNPETKETARKQSGSFYTPREIVNYMVDESLIAYLTNASPDIDEKIVRQLFTNDCLPEELKKSPENCNKLVDAIKAAKMLDPACGSGAFPMGMLNRMLNILQKLENTHSNYNTKLHLIENCIYGIDIQTIAVQITKLRFFISLICEQTPTKDEATNYGIIALPNLETKFVAANTLIGLAKKPEQGNLFEDPEVEITKNALKDIRHRHFSATNANQKKEFRKHDAVLREKLAKLLEENSDCTHEDALQLATWNPYDQNTSSTFFDAEWMFGIKGGFDLVIGNPPYFSISSLEKKNQEIYKSQFYFNYSKSTDIYCLFFEKGINLSKKDAHICFITSNQWLQTNYGRVLRQFFQEHSNPITLINFGGLKVFESATVDTSILILKRGNCEFRLSACHFKNDYDIKQCINEYFDKNKILLTNYIYERWTITDSYKSNLSQKIRNKGKQLLNWDVEIFRGLLTGLNEAFIIDSVKKEDLINEDKRNAEILKPLLRGRDVHKYHKNWNELWLITTRNGIDIEDYPSILRYLGSFGEKINNRSDQGENWWNLRACNYYENFDFPKIIYPETTVRRSEFYLDDEGYYIDKTCFMITGVSLSYLNAILSSKLMEWFLETELRSLGKKSIQYSKQYIEQIPIPEISSNKQNLIIDMIEIIHSLKKENPQSYTTDLEQQIDNLVYKLYDLTYDEVKVVDPDFGLSEEEYTAINI